MPVVTFTDQADAAEIIPAPAAGCFIRILGGELSNNAAVGVCSLKSNGNIKWQTEQMQQTPFAIQLNIDKERTIDGEPGKSFTIGASTGAVSGSLEYIILGMENRQLFTS